MQIRYASSSEYPDSKNVGVSAPLQQVLDLFYRLEKEANDSGFMIGELFDGCWFADEKEGYFIDRFDMMARVFAAAYKTTPIPEVLFVIPSRVIRDNYYILVVDGKDREAQDHNIYRQLKAILKEYMALVVDVAYNEPDDVTQLQCQKS